MSLDVYLTYPHPQACGGPKIFIRENGATKEITREEWDQRYPGRDPVIFKAPETNEVYRGNITHNLVAMATEASIYHPLWRPEEFKITKASQLIPYLRRGLVMLRDDPPRYKLHNPANGWGSYEGLIQFIEEYLAACEANPDADVSVWR